MVKKSTLLAAIVVAVVCGSAPQAQAQAIWMASWGVHRWHNHFADQAGTGGWDYASSGFGHHGWGSSPRDWALVIGYSARPWPAFFDGYVHGHHHHDGRVAHFGWRPYHPGYAGHGGHGYGYGVGPLGDAVYDDVNGTIHDGGIRGVIPGAGGPALEYEPKVPPKKEGELVEPPVPPKKTALPTTTKLVLNVPADAKVTLAGVDTKSSGATREFVTSLLAGSPWTNYAVRVELQRDGKTLVDERSVTLYPGDNQVMTIDFAPAQVASK